MNVIYERPTDDFVIRILSQSEKYPGRLPAIMGMAKTPSDHIAYFRKKELDYLRKYDRHLFEVKDAVDAMADRYNKFRKVLAPFFSDYDKEFVLPTTVALGIWNSASTDLDAQGTLGLDTDVTYPEAVITALAEDYLRYGKVEREMSESMPRGKFVGYPYMIGGMDRYLNDVLLASSAAIAVGARAKLGSDPRSLEYAYNMLRAYHGEPFAMEGSRQQHTAKELPVIIKEGIYSSENFNPRYRIINMESKISVMDIRREIKQMLAYILAHPVHTQDRAALKKWVSDETAKGRYLVSMDQSKYDFRHGGDRGRQQIDLHGKVLKSARYIESAKLSFNSRFISLGHKKLWEIPGDALLKSGMGTTTLIGCTGNLTAIVAVLSDVFKVSPSEVLRRRGDTWDARTWGDDSVLSLPSAKVWEAVQDGMKRYKLEVEPEPTLKYLGSNYGPGPDFKGTLDQGYSVGRFFQQQLFPERAKMWPFNIVGYIARLDLVGSKAEDIHKAMLPLFDELELGEPFAFSERHAVLDRLIPEMEKKSRDIGLIDDVLQVFTHGLDSLDGLGEFDEVYYKLLGLSTAADLSDPVRFLSTVREEDKTKTNKISNGIIKGVEELSKGDFTNYSRFLTELVAVFRLTYPAGDVLY